MSKLLIIWKIISVDKKKRRMQRHKRISFDCKVSLEREELGIFDKDVMLNTSQLNAEQQIMVDIALRRKELMDDLSFFIPLRYLFKNYTDNNSLSFDKMEFITMPQYHEDEDDNPLDEIEFVQTISGIKDLIQLHDGNFVQDCVFPNNGDDANIPELTMIEKKDFAFLEDDIWCLNTFIHDSFQLSKSPLIRAPHPFKLEIKNMRSHFVQNITNEQFVSSLIAFRKLYMEGEPCNFLKAMKKMTDKRKIHHPIYKVFNQFREKYNYYLKQISSINIFRRILQMTGINADDLSSTVTGQNIIKSMLYTGLIHQGDEQEHKLRSSLEKELKTSDVLEFFFCYLISNIASICQKSAILIYNILQQINVLGVAIPQTSISDAERRFHIFVIKKSYELSEIIWKEQGCSPKGCLQYLEHAMRKIDSTFKRHFFIDED